jgi:hypothetical protein
VLLSASAYPAAAGTEIIDRVLAVVSGNLIMLSDVHAVRDLRLMDVPEKADPVRDILPRLIDRALILAEVERYAPPEPDPEAVNRRVEAVRVLFPSPEAFATALARVGFDERHLRETLRQDLRILAYLDQRFTVQPPSDEDLGRYYREHPELFTPNGQLTPFEQVRSRIVEIATAERRQRLVDEWVAGLRQRAEIIESSTGATLR